MANSITIADFPKICRLCLALDEILPILSIDELDLLIYVTKIQIHETDSLPNNICNKCLAQLKVISYFINTCKSSYNFLQSIIFKQNFVQKSDKDSEPETENNLADEKCNITHLKRAIIDIVPDEIEIMDDATDSTLPDKYEKGRKTEDLSLFLCNFCGKSFSTKNGLDRHVLSHTGVKSFECNNCGKTFITKDTLKKHMVMHTGTKAYKCEICNKCFSQSSHLSYHLKRHMGEKPHKCNFCPKVFLSKYHLERHKIIHTGIRPFSCKRCNKTFHNVSLLKHHNKSNSCDIKKLFDSQAKEYLCTICGKCFTAIGTLNVHIRSHTGETPFCCTHCNNSYNNSSSLKRHIMRKHTGEKPHVCQLCTKAYHDSTNLKRHLKRVHTATHGKSVN